MVDPLSSAAEAAKMMTLVLNTHMKLKAGMVERKITAAKAKCPKCKGAKSLHGRLIVGKAAGRHRKSGGAFRMWCDNCDDVRMMEMSSRLNTDPLYTTAGILRRDLGQRLCRFVELLNNLNTASGPDFKGCDWQTTDQVEIERFLRDPLNGKPFCNRMMYGVCKACRNSGPLKMMAKYSA